MRPKFVSPCPATDAFAPGRLSHSGLPDVDKTISRLRDPGLPNGHHAFKLNSQKSATYRPSLAGGNPLPRYSPPPLACYLRCVAGARRCAGWKCCGVNRAVRGGWEFMKWDVRRRRGDKLTCSPTRDQHWRGGGSRGHRDSRRLSQGGFKAVDEVERRSKWSERERREERRERRDRLRSGTKKIGQRESVNGRRDQAAWLSTDSRHKGHSRTFLAARASEGAGETAANASSVGETLKTGDAQAVG
jgi:hypothetical protein